MTSPSFDRHHFNRSVLGAVAASTLPALTTERAAAADDKGFNFRYIVGSAMYGYTDVAEIMPEEAKTGATAAPPPTRGDAWSRIGGVEKANS